MKKLLFLALALVTFMGYAQEEVEQFEVDINGINGYVVKDYEGKTAQELYNKVFAWAQYNLGSADKAKKSSVEGEYLKYEIYKSNVFKVRNGFTDIVFDLEEDIEFRFKDGKIRFDIVIKDMPVQNNETVTRMHLKGGFTTWSFYKNNGKAKKQTADALLELNAHLNSIVERVTKHVNGETKNNDW